MLYFLQKISLFRNTGGIKQKAVIFIVVDAVRRRSNFTCQTPTIYGIAYYHRNMFKTIVISSQYPASNAINWNERIVSQRETQAGFQFELV